MQIACACASASMISSRPIAHSWLSIVLVMPWANNGPSASVRARAPASLQEIGARMQRVEKAPALSLLGRHRAAGEQKLGGAALADDPRQNAAGPHIGAGEADAGEQEGGLGLRRRQPQVGGHRQDRAGAGAYAIDGSDDRLRAAAHRLDDIAGHSCEGEEVGHRHSGQRLDDFEDVAARAEIVAGAGQHDRAYVGGMAKIAEEVAQFGIAFECQRIFLVRPVERDRRHAAVLARRPTEMARRIILERLFAGLHGVAHC